MQFFVQIELKMEPGDCPPLNINAMHAVSVKSFLKVVLQRSHGCFFSIKVKLIGGR